MIDIYDRVFGIVWQAAKGADPSAVVQDSFIEKPPAFPCVTVQETNNVTTTTPIGTRNTEKYARCTYQVEVYARGDNRRTICRRIMAAVSDALITANFERELMAATPNYRDNTVYRLTARFRTYADNDNNTYRR